MHEEALGAYFREDITLDALVVHQDDNHDWTHHGNIEAALGYHGADRWSGPTGLPMRRNGKAERSA